VLRVLGSLAPRAGDSGLSAATAVRAKRHDRMMPTSAAAVPDLCIDHRPMASERSKEVGTMAVAERVRARGSDHELELAKYLWEEFKYRHDLIWRLLFRVTAVAALLSIAPFTISDVAGSKAGFWVKFLPALAIGLVLASWIVLLVELRLFRPIDRQYVRAQDSVVGEPVRKAGRLERMFEWVVRLYPGFLLILTIIVGCIVWFRHTPS
jgi:hypothetical protein